MGKAAFKGRWESWLVARNIPSILIQMSMYSDEPCYLMVKNSPLELDGIADLIEYS